MAPGMSVVNAAKTHCPQGHEYTDENTRLYRGSRYCRACDRFHSRQYVRRVKPQIQRPEGWRSEYDARRHQAIRNGTWQYRETKRRPKIGESVLDLLLIEGGWWTLDGICLRLPFNRKSISRILSRLRTKGQVCSRRVGLATGTNRMGLDSRLEWKAEPSQMMLDFG